MYEYFSQNYEERVSTIKDFVDGNDIIKILMLITLAYTLQLIFS